MKIDNIDFSKGFVEGFKSEADFLEEMEGEGYKEAIFKGEKNRTARLKEVYALHHPKKPKPEAAEKPKVENASAKPGGSTK